MIHFQSTYFIGYLHCTEGQIFSISMNLGSVAVDRSYVVSPVVFTTSSAHFAPFLYATTFNSPGS